jgi:hypothetical protein
MRFSSKICKAIAKNAAGGILALTTVSLGAILVSEFWIGLVILATGVGGAVGFTWAAHYFDEQEKDIERQVLVKDNYVNYQAINVSDSPEDINFSSSDIHFSLTDPPLIDPPCIIPVSGETLLNLDSDIA